MHISNTHSSIHSLTPTQTNGKKFICVCATHATSLSQIPTFKLLCFEFMPTSSSFSLILAFPSTHLCTYVYVCVLARGMNGAMRKMLSTNCACMYLYVLQQSNKVVFPLLWSIFGIVTTCFWLRIWYLILRSVLYVLRHFLASHSNIAESSTIMYVCLFICVFCKRTFWLQS